MAHGDSREGKWRGNWRMEWLASTLHTTSEHGLSSITTPDAHISAASSRLNWRPRRIKWTRLFRRKTKSGFCACAINHISTGLYNPDGIKHLYLERHITSALGQGRVLFKPIVSVFSKTVLFWTNRILRSQNISALKVMANDIQCHIYHRTKWK